MNFVKMCMNLNVANSVTNDINIQYCKISLQLTHDYKGCFKILIDFWKVRELIEIEGYWSKKGLTFLYANISNSH
jgi:hypothetical protein